MIHVLAIITAKPGLRHRVLEAFHANIAAVRAEPGCIEYGAGVDVEASPSKFASWGPDSFVVVEKWENMAALRAHSATPHMQAFTAQVKDWTVNIAVHVLAPTSPSQATEIPT